MTDSFPWWAWLALGVVVLAMLAVDLFAHRGDRVDSRRSAVAWTGIWIAVSLAFNAGLLVAFGREPAAEFLAAYLMEKSLSVDNLFVFLLLFTRLGIPTSQQRRVLTWGIFGAILTRGLFIAGGAALLSRFHGLLYAFGALLVVVGARLLFPESENKGGGRLVPFLQRHLHLSSAPHPGHFVVREGGRRVATTLLLALLAVELTDVVFALDSIPAGFSITQRPFLLYSANLFAVLGLRSLFLVLSDLLSELRYLRFGLAGVLIFAGGKMLLSSRFHVSPLASLAVIVVCVGVAVGASLWARGRERARKTLPSPSGGGGGGAGSGDVELAVRSSVKPGVTLAAMLRRSLILLVVLAAVAAVLLGTLTQRLHREAEELGQALEEVNVAQQLQIGLLEFEDASNAYVRLGDEAHRVTKLEQEAQLRTELARPRTASEELFAVARREVYAYLDARSVAEARSQDLDQIVEQSQQRLEAAGRALRAVVDQKLVEGQRAQERAESWNRYATIGSLIFGALLLLGVLWVALGTRRDLYRPLVAIRSALSRYAQGEREVRAPEVGPEELRGVAGAFNRMASQLARQRDQQLALLAGVVHDLRNPLSALKLAASAARPERKATEAKLRQSLEVVGRQVDRLDRLAGDLMDQARAEVGELPLALAERDLREVVRESEALYRPMFSEVDIRLTVVLGRSAVRVQVDAIRLEQALNNLLSNAIKYSPPHSEVTLAVWTEGGEAVVAVRDQGRGIPEDELENIFVPFHRSRDVPAGVPGTGLGLAGARRIIEAHGGRLEVQSVLGRGATFRIRLPRADVPAALGPPSTER